MLKKILFPLGIVLAGTYIWRKISLFKKLDFYIKNVKFDFSFINQRLVVMVGLVNKTSETGFLQDLYGNMYFIDTDNKEIFIGTMQTTSGQRINLLPNQTSFAEFIVNLRGIRTIQSIISLITNKKGSVKFVGTIKALGITQSIDTTYKLA